MAKPAIKPGLYCMLIELEDITPRIWRRFWIESGVSVLNLHHTIQAVMGWTGAHLHHFQIGESRYAMPDPEDDPAYPVVDERRAVLQKVLDGITTFGYEYDFGDGWQHRITVEQRTPQPKHWRGCAFVDAGERACPPEDAGGAHGYQEFLDQFGKSRRSKAGREFLQWAGEDFDPGQYDRHAANAALLRMAWNRWGIP